MIHPSYSGEGRLLLPDGRGGWSIAATAPNAWSYTWAEIAVRMCGGDPAWVPSFLYLEFVNGASMPVSPPSTPRSDGALYYLSLAGSPDRDYLRIPITAREGWVDASIPGHDALPPGFRNSIRLGGVSADAVGVLGKPFSAGAGSVCIGSAVAAGPFPDDPTKDVVWSRAYYSGGNQFSAPDSGSVYVEHSLKFG